MGIASGSSSLSMTNLFNNSQLLGTLFPSLNMSAIQAAFQSQELQIEQPLTNASSQLGTLSAPLKAWQTMQADLQTLQTDAVTLSGTSLYQSITASSTDPAAVTASGSGQGTFGSYQVAINSLMAPEIVNGTGQASSSTALGLSGSFSINGTSISVSSSDSLSQIAGAINDANAGVTATVMNTGSGSTPYVLNLASTEGKTITWYDPNGILQKVGILNANGTINDQVQAASPASYSINGVSLTSPTNSDTSTIPGVTLNFLGTTGSVPATVSVSQNTAAIQQALSQFVSDFNQFLSDSQTNTGQGGAIEGNATINAVTDQLMSIVTSSMASQPSSMSSLADLGISLSAPVGSPNNFTMSLNSTTLQSALQSNPSGVAALLGGSGGLATQMQSLLSTALGSNGGVTAAISTLQSQQQTLENDLGNSNSAMNQMVNQQLQALQAQFSTMLSTMVSMAGQSSAISAYTNYQYSQSVSGGTVG